MSLEDLKKPLNLQSRDDYDLLNPYGKLTCLLLNLFTMEFGRPPLYSEINRSSHSQKKVKVMIRTDGSEQNNMETTEELNQLHLVETLGPLV